MTWSFVAGLTGLRVRGILSIHTGQGHLPHAHLPGSSHHQIQTKPPQKPCLCKVYTISQKISPSVKSCLSNEQTLKLISACPGDPILLVVQKVFLHILWIAVGSHPLKGRLVLHLRDGCHQVLQVVWTSWEHWLRNHIQLVHSWTSELRLESMWHGAVWYIVLLIYRSALPLRPSRPPPPKAKTLPKDASLTAYKTQQDREPEQNRAHSKSTAEGQATRQTRPSLSPQRGLYISVCIIIIVAIETFPCIIDCSNRTRPATHGACWKCSRKWWATQWDSSCCFCWSSSCPTSTIYATKALPSGNTVSRKRKRN